MINTKELTIGCYVKVNGKPYKVDEVFNNAVGLEKWDTLFHYSELEPIPITKELLLKNGFVEDIDDGTCFISKCFDIYKVNIMWDLATPSDIFCNVFYKENTRLCGTLDYIKYIHQAQTFCNVLGIELEFKTWK